MLPVHVGINDQMRKSLNHTTAKGQICQESYKPVCSVVGAAPTAHLSMAVADTASTDADVFDTVVILQEKKSEKLRLKEAR